MVINPWVLDIFRYLVPKIHFKNQRKICMVINPWVSMKFCSMVFCSKNNNRNSIS
jgi:hypothetical protein